MSQEASHQSPAMRVLEETTIVDCDVHTSLSTEQVAEHLDEPYKSRYQNPYCYPNSKGSDWDPMMGEKIDLRRINSPEDVQEDLVEGMHVDYPLLNTIAGLNRLPDDDLAVNLMRATNNALIETYLDPTDFYGLGVVAPHDPEAAAEEIDRLASEKQIAGLFLETFGQHPPMGDPSLDPIYQAAEENELHMAFHGGAATGFKADFPMQNQELNKFLEIHILAHLWQQSLALTSMIVEGVPQKFPDLNFVFLEAGVSWVPYMMWRLNKEYSIRRSEAPLLEKSPEEYIRDQFYFASQPLGEPNNPGDLQQVLEVIGTNCLAFASDYPHWDFDHPEELGKHLKTNFSEQEREQVLNKSPAEAFGLNI